LDGREMHSLHEAEQKCTVKIFLSKPNVKKSLLRHISTCEDNTEIDFKKDK
jgi:hypothetical protein